MVHVGAKPVSARTAVATAVVRMTPQTAQLLAEGRLPKGDAAAVARVAGIMAAKRTPELIPLCHPIRLSSVAVDVEVDAGAGTALVTATVGTEDRTGVEMEALVGAGVAAFTLYDMIKGVERGAAVEHVRLESKQGGSRGDWSREP
ncbi:MAG: cyclic pyranopterin monophosphate synthase MoaC [Nitriliruptorales bacterium]|nr:cyclic pyranopterin monophosphate synthase MoaC [Nitriliruptorales bacterium]